MKNKQRLYFALNLVVLMPIFIIVLLRLLTIISIYLRIESQWLGQLTDISYWYLEIIIPENSPLGMEFVYMIAQVLLSLLLIIAGYFSGLLRGTAFKTMLGIFVGGLILVLISIPIQQRLNDRDKVKLIEEFNKQKDANIKFDENFVPPLTPQ